MIHKKNLLWISAYLPYDSVNHAGGKIHNYYLKKLIQSNQFDIRLISFYVPSEMGKFTLNKSITCDLICYDTGIKKIIRGIRDLNYKHNPFHKYANMANRFSLSHILRLLNNYKKEEYIPDIIILQWTQIILFAPIIRAIFPDSKIVGIEEDVALLSYKRKAEFAPEGIRKRIEKIRFNNIEREEINALNHCNLVILNNYKDFKLLEKYYIKPKIKVWAPYFDNFLNQSRSNDINHSVIFYGAMNRRENYLSAIWFIENVMPLLKDEGVKFVIVGGNPDMSLKKYEGEQVVLTGFVNDVGGYFENALCLAAPLVLGAGIKIKILEAMSAGIPVLTNDIGIEGIYAEKGKEYFYCKKPFDYAKTIKELLNEEIDTKKISVAEKQFIEKQFDYENSSKEFVQWMGELIEK